MFRASFVLRGCSSALGSKLPERAIELLLESLAAWNVELLSQMRRRNIAFPRLYESGVRYERERNWIQLPDGRIERVGLEDWIDCLEAVRRGQADCEDLACWRAAELRLEGLPAKVLFFIGEHDGRRLFHIIVDRGDGQLEDPSRALGMRP